MKGEVNVVGVTGGIGAGKSEFANAMKRLGAGLIDADRVAQTIVEENRGLQKEIRKTFGRNIFTEENQLKRRELGQRVFSDKQQLDKLNKIIQQPLIKTIRNSIGILKQCCPLVVLDMALLFETGLNDDCNVIVFINASKVCRIKREIALRGWGREEIVDRMKSQENIFISKKHANYVIENNESLNGLVGKAETIYKKYLQ